MYNGQLTLAFFISQTEEFHESHNSLRCPVFDFFPLLSRGNSVNFV